MRGEVLIVGGGLIGSSIAWRLAQKGVPVILADAGNLGGEASSAGAGMLSPGGEFTGPSAWLDLGVESLKMYPSFIDELRAETGLPIDFRVCGCQIVGGEYYPDDALVDPAELLRALRCACEKRKVGIVRERLTLIESIGDAAVVIAAGAWSGQLRVDYQGRTIALPATVPVKGHLIGFQLAPGSLGRILRQGETYVLQRANGFVIAGSNEEESGFDQTVDPIVCEDIHRRAAGLFPALKDAVPVKRWIGFRPRSAEGDAPHLGRVEGTNVWLAYGHYRNGILLTPISARKIADEIGDFIASSRT